MAIDTLGSKTTTFAKGAQGTTQTKGEILEMHSIATMRENAAMYRALCEGTLGRAFQMFHASDPAGAMRVIEAALIFWCVSMLNPQYCAEKEIQVFEGEPMGIGAYAHQYTEVVAEMAEPHLPHWTYHMGPVAWQRDAWEWFAQNVTKAPRTGHSHAIGTPCHTRCSLWGRA